MEDPEVNIRSEKSSKCQVETEVPESSALAQAIFLLLTILSPMNKNKPICSCGIPKLQSQGYIVTCACSCC